MYNDENGDLGPVEINGLILTLSFVCGAGLAIGSAVIFGLQTWFTVLMWVAAIFAVVCAVVMTTSHVLQYWVVENLFKFGTVFWLVVWLGAQVVLRFL